MKQLGKVNRNEKIIPGIARLNDDLSHLENAGVEGQETSQLFLSPVPHLIEWFDNREISLNSERDGQVDTACHGALQDEVKARLPDINIILYLCQRKTVWHNVVPGMAGIGVAQVGYGEGEGRADQVEGVHHSQG